MKNLTLELEKIKAAYLYRQLKDQTISTSTRGLVNGRETIIFAGNDYLGLACHPEIKKAAIKATEKYGNSACASRLISGNNQLYKELEAKLAQFKDKEAALVFPTGYMANLALLSALAGPEDIIYMDKLNHASLYDGCRLSGAKLKRYHHKDIEQLEKWLQADNPKSQKFIVTDGVFSMDGDIAPLNDLNELARQYKCLLIVDDAHGTGVLGDNGRGSTAFLMTPADIEIGTLSKAIGSLGGFVAASAQVIDYLVNKARPFIFTTGLPPACLASSIKALEIIQSESWRQEKVLELALKARSTLRNAGFEVLDGITPIIPIVIGEEQKALRIADSCLKNGIYIPAIRTPAVPKSKARLRMTVGAEHTEEELNRALGVLIKVAKPFKED